MIQVLPALSLARFGRLSISALGLRYSTQHALVQQYLENARTGKITINTRQLDVIHRMAELDAKLPLTSTMSGSKIKGLYLYGGTGCGKTMMMDIFFDNSKVPSNLKLRTHFHSFMLDIHKRLHKIRKNKTEGGSISSWFMGAIGKKSTTGEPLSFVAKDIVEEHGYLLCLDEFQVVDVADAMMLKRLFTFLWQQGVVIVATSNRAPDELYWGGLNRDVFLPFIPVLKAHNDIIDLAGMTDYRVLHELGEDRYFYPLSDSGTSDRMRSVWTALADKSVGSVGPMSLSVQMGREIHVPTAYTRHDVHADDNAYYQHVESHEVPALLSTADRPPAFSCCKFHFEELCDEAVGAADYMALAKQFHTILITDIPLFDFHNRNQMRRFITLIDVLYDAKVQLVCSADAAPENIYKPTAVHTPTEVLYHRSLSHSSNSSPSNTDSAGVGGEYLPALKTGVVAQGGSSGRSHTTITADAVGSGSGSEGGIATDVEWSATGLEGVTLADLNPRKREDEEFAFQRTVSRLLEMQSKEYTMKTP